MNKVTLLSTLVVVGFFSVPALAGTPLSGEQIKQLASGNTIALHSLARSTNFKIYYAPDGSAISHNESTGKNYPGTWRITDSGEWCNHWPPAPDRCGQVFDNGDGTYNRMENGSLRSVWKKIYPSNIIAK